MESLTSVADGVEMDWRQQLAFVVATMREMSTHTDPQEMRLAYTQRMRTLLPVDGSLSLSRRDLPFPAYRITRSTRWQEDINPWKQKERLPLLRGGVLAEWIYGEKPLLLSDFQVPADDPAFEYLDGFRSVAVIPMYDRGTSVNMVVLLRHEADAFRPDGFPQLVWVSNLYGRATHNLVLSEQLKEALEEVEHELKVVADIQKSLLPMHMPHIPNLGLAAYYQASRHAGGDYYDFFPLPDGRWGLLIADVSGHGTPAAVLMAVSHSLAHTFPGPHDRPGALLEYLNHKLYHLHTSHNDTFVTAFHGIYDPHTRRLDYASAGHNPPLLKRCADGSMLALDEARRLPLGISADTEYPDATVQLMPCDQVVLYTDGITEAYDPAGRMFGTVRLDRVLENCAIAASDLLRAVLDALDEFTADQPPHDDRTLLVLKVM
ncbi:MAG: PP2C family protein-serine/threonine phosphatase [Gemmataceae bacterium]